jgi:hypothetical protein
VVEHSLGKGEVVSSILTGSTRKYPRIEAFTHSSSGALGNSERNVTETGVFNPCKIRAVCSGVVRAFPEVLLGAAEGILEIPLTLRWRGS